VDCAMGYCLELVLLFRDCGLTSILGSIRKEIQEVIDGKYPADNNVLVNSPHPAKVLSILSCAMTLSWLRLA